MTQIAKPQIGLPDHNREVDGPFVPRYDLTQEELSQLETELVGIIRGQQGSNEAVCAAWISPTSKFSNFLRTKEAQNFPEVDGVDPYYEKHQRYIALVDLRGEGRIVHAATIMNFDDSTDSSEVQPAQEKRTGLYTVDSLINLGNFTRDEFVDYYQRGGVDVDKSISIETNFKIVDDFDPFMTLGSADLTYLTIFNMLIDGGAPREGTLVVASINEKQIDSFKRTHIKFDPLLGRTDFRTEEEALGKESHPIAIDFASAYDILTPIQVKLPEAFFN